MVRGGWVAGAKRREHVASGIVSSFPAEAFLGNVGPGDGVLVAHLEERYPISEYCGAAQILEVTTELLQRSAAAGTCGQIGELSRQHQGSSVPGPSIPGLQLSLCD